MKQEGQGPNARRRVGAPWVGRRTRTWFDSEYLKWSEKTRTEGLAGLKDFIRGLMATAAARKALCPGPGDLTLDLRAAMSMGGVLIVIRVPRTSVGAEPAYAIARHVVKMLQDFSLERSELYDVLWPCALYLDELPTLIGRSVDDAMDVAGWMTLLRKNGFALTSAFQGTALLTDVIEGTLDSNARNKLFAGGLGADDARKIQATLGRTEQVVEDERVSRTAPLSPRPATFSRGKRTQERPRYTEEELRYLPLGTWFFSGLKDRSEAPPVRLRIPPVGSPGTLSSPRALQRTQSRRPRRAGPRERGGAHLHRYRVLVRRSKRRLSEMYRANQATTDQRIERSNTQMNEHFEKEHSKGISLDAETVLRFGNYLLAAVALALVSQLLAAAPRIRPGRPRYLLRRRRR